MPLAVPPDLIEKARVLDNYYVPTRYAYARGDWGVGSDLDLIALVREADEPFERRALSWNLNPLPVPSELLVYTEAEWRRLDARSRFSETVMRQAVWVYPQSAERGRLVPSLV